MSATIDVLRRGDRLRGALSPLRRRLLEELREPASATALAERLGESRQRVNYHVRELEHAGLVELVEARQRRGCVERVVRARARAVVVDPDVIGDVRATTQDRFATDTLLAMTARTLRDVSRMRERAAERRKRLVTFAIEVDVGLERPADIERFANALGERLAEVAASFDTGGAGRRYRVVIGGHPAPKPEDTR